MGLTLGYELLASFLPCSIEGRVPFATEAQGMIVKAVSLLPCLMKYLSEQDWGGSWYLETLPFFEFQDSGPGTDFQTQGLNLILYPP